MNTKNSMLCWNNNSDEVKIIQCPDCNNLSKGYRNSTLACFSKYHKLKKEDAKKYVFIEAIHLIIRDNVNPIALHNELLKLEEYRDGCSDDMPFLIEHLTDDEKNERLL